MAYNTIPYQEELRQKTEAKTLALIDNSKLSSTQRETIMQYYNALRLGKKIGFERRGRIVAINPKSYKSFESYVRVAITFGEFTKKDYIEVTKFDVEKWQISFQNKLTHMGTRVKPDTIEHYSVILKVFYIWLYGDGTIPKPVEDIQRRRKDIEPLKESEVLTPTEINKLLRACSRNRDKAIISLLFETGVRVGELISCNINDFISYGRYAKVRVRGKTGMRTIAIANCVVYVEQWLNEHPNNHDDNAPLFTSVSENNKFNRLTGRGVACIISRVAERIGITKRYNPHWFRHSGLDYYTRKTHANERDLKMRAGWHRDSSMHFRYIHYGEDEVNENYLKAMGVTTKKRNHNEDKLLEPKECSRCKKIFPDDGSRWLHPPTAKYCHCGQILDIGMLKHIENVQKEADKFAEIMLKQPMGSSVDLSNGTTKALYDSMMQNPLLLDRFKEVLTKNKLI